MTCLELALVTPVSASSSPASCPFRQLLEKGAGDLLAARTCASLLLGGLALGGGGAAARMVLAAACLHIGAQLGSEPTLQDVHALLRALAQPEAWAWATLRQSPLQFVQYMVEELRSGHADTASEAISLAIQAVASTKHT